MYSELPNRRLESLHRRPPPIHLGHLLAYARIKRGNTGDVATDSDRQWKEDVVLLVLVLVEQDHLSGGQ